MTKILLVEDNEMNRDMLLRRLKRRGFEVSVAVDGAESIDMVQSDRPDLILMDMSLPVMDGYQATRILKENPETRPIPVLGLSAHAMTGDAERALDAGCDDYDTKPVEIKRLLGKIDALLEGTGGADSGETTAPAAGSAAQPPPPRPSPAATSSPPPPPPAAGPAEKPSPAGGEVEQSGGEQSKTARETERGAETYSTVPLPPLPAGRTEPGESPSTVVLPSDWEETALGGEQGKAGNEPEEAESQPPRRESSDDR